MPIMRRSNGWRFAENREMSAAATPVRKAARSISLRCKSRFSQAFDDADGSKF
jgi:hypothetical protein